MLSAAIKISDTNLDSFADFTVKSNKFLFLNFLKPIEGIITATFSLFKFIKDFLFFSFWRKFL